MIIEMPGLRIVRFEAAPGERVRAHRHANLHLFAMLAGGMEQDAPGGPRRLSPGHVRMSDAQASHDVDFGDAGADCLVIHVLDGARRRVRPPKPGGSRFSADQELAGAMQAVALAGRMPGVGVWLAARRALAAAASAVEERRPGPAWLQECFDARLDGRRSRWEARLSSEHVIRAFVRGLGVTPGEATRAGMLKRVERALCDPAASLADVALEAGFAHQSHLTNVMRRTIGITPARLRRASIPCKTAGGSPA